MTRPIFQETIEKFFYLGSTYFWTLPCHPLQHYLNVSFLHFHFQTLNEPIIKVWMSYNYPHPALSLPQVIQGLLHILYILSLVCVTHTRVHMCKHTHMCFCVSWFKYGEHFSNRQMFSHWDTSQLSPHHKNNHIWKNIQLNDFFHKCLVHLNVGLLSVLWYPVSYAHTHIYTSIMNKCAPHLLTFFSLQFPSFHSPL